MVKKKENKFVVNSRIIRNVAILVAILLIGFVGGRYVSVSNAASCRAKTTSPGARGTCVQDAQYILNGECSIAKEIRYPKCSKLETDGVFGSKTTRQVQVFQKSLGIKQNGVVDRQTWTWLCNAATSKRFRNSTIDKKWAYIAARDAGC